ncbi:MAG: dipeptidase [Maricaulaceae bacterium]
MKLIGFGLAAVTLLGAGTLFGSQLSKIDGQMNAVTPHAAYVISDAAQALHDSLTIADLHTDTLLWDRDPTKRNDYGHVDLPRLAEGGVNLQIFSAVTKTPDGQNFNENASDSDGLKKLVMAQMWPMRTWNSLYERAAYQAQRLQKLEANAKNNLVIIRNAADLDAAEGKLATLLLTEGAHPLEGKLENIARLYNEGYRIMGLQHFFDNELGGSMHGTSKAGLTKFGKDAVREMSAQGIIIDVAHSSEAVVRDVLALTDKPVIISHGGVVAHCPRTANRNLPDELTTAIAERGGIIGIGYFSGAICDISPKGIAKAIKDAVTLLGADAVALGSDFDGGITASLDTSELAVITQELMNAGLDEAVIRKVMGENAYRFFAENLPQ